MPISGSDKALMPALSGVARAGATRSGYHSAQVFVTINGTIIEPSATAKVLLGSLTITDIVDETPNRCAMTVYGATPTKGQSVVVQLGSVNNTERVFAGQILQAERVMVEHTDVIIHRISAIDYTFLGDRRLVTKRYTNQSATAIARDVIATFTSGFTTVNVVAGLATVDEITFTNQSVSGALTQLAKRIGAYWYWDYFKDLHFFLTDIGQNPIDLTSAHASLMQFDHATDLSQIITRVLVEGNGSTASADVAVGAPVLPVEDASFFNVAGGTVVSGPQAITYTATSGTSGTGSTVDSFAPTSATPLANNVNAGFGMTVGAAYQIAVSFVSTNGESRLSPSSGAVVATTDGAGGAHGMTASPIPLGPAGTTARVIYRTLGNGSVFYADQTINDNTTVASVNVGVSSDVVLVTSAPAPLASTGGPDRPAGSTSIAVVDTSAFSATGGFVHVAGQVVRYTGRSTSSGVGSLTGVPGAGNGSILAPISAGSPIATHPTLTGIPASGAGAIQYAINMGDTINLRVTVNDAAAQATIAALEGGDGIHEESVQDRRLSATEATARGTALLALRSAAEVSLQYRVRDKHTTAGKSITVNFAGVTGTFKIQEVVISGFNNDGIYPTYEAKASSTRFSLEGLLRDIHTLAQSA